MQKQKKILFADDDIEFLKTYRKIVERAGFSVIEVYNGEEAITVSFTEHPDLLILDMSMPSRSGLEVLKAIRADSWGQTLPIIILTGKTITDKDLSEVTELYPTYYIIKGNISSEELISKITEVIK